MRRLQNWSYSLLLVPLYLGSFHLWNYLDRPAIIATGVLSTLIGTALLYKAQKQNYFTNRWDCLFHASVVFDLFMEGVFIPYHSGLGFYFCGIGFLLIVGGYRLWRLPKAPNKSDEPSSSYSHG